MEILRQSLYRISLGIVALRKNDRKVVGFRGYFAENWQCNGTQFKVLVAGDTCVLPKYRRKGLSVAMGFKAMEEYTSDYDLFLNFSSIPASSRGYLKLGFIPLVDKYNLERHIGGDVNAGTFDLGKFNNILVSNRPNPRELHNLASKEIYNNMFSMVQDESFFEWRFKNKKSKYTFCYYIKDDSVKSYVVFGTQNEYRKGHILDYTENDTKGFEKIIKHAIGVKFFNTISIGNFNLSPGINKCLQDLGFKSNFKAHKKTVPVFVRTSKKHFEKNDWFIEGLDIRDIKNWKLKGICSEWA